MKRRIVKSWFQLVVASSLIAFATLARADVPGPLEIAVGTGYTRGLGSAGGRMPGLQHLAGDGGALRLEIGWRIDPRWMIGVYQEGALFAAGHEGTDGMTASAAGVQGQFHVRPLAALDPWIGVGFGWRGLWLDHGMGTHSMQGLDLARLQVGVDYRVSPRFSLAPVVGVSATEILKEKRPGATSYANVSDRKVSAFVFAGLSGRMDILGGWSPRR
jgi:hypothetical protein